MEDDNNTLQQMRKGFFGKSTCSAPVADASLNESLIIASTDNDVVDEPQDNADAGSSNGVEDMDKSEDNVQSDVIDENPAEESSNEPMEETVSDKEAEANEEQNVEVPTSQEDQSEDQQMDTEDAPATNGDEISDTEKEVARETSAEAQTVETAEQDSPKDDVEPVEEVPEVSSQEKENSPVENDAEDDEAEDAVEEPVAKTPRSLRKRATKQDSKKNVQKEATPVEDEEDETSPKDDAMDTTEEPEEQVLATPRSTRKRATKQESTKKKTQKEETPVEDDEDAPAEKDTSEEPEEQVVATPRSTRKRPTKQESTKKKTQKEETPVEDDEDAPAEKDTSEEPEEQVVATPRSTRKRPTKQESSKKNAPKEDTPAEDEKDAVKEPEEQTKPTPRGKRGAKKDSGKKTVQKEESPVEDEENAIEEPEEQTKPTPRGKRGAKKNVQKEETPVEDEAETVEEPEEPTIATPRSKRGAKKTKEETPVEDEEDAEEPEESTKATPRSTRKRGTKAEPAKDDISTPTPPTRRSGRQPAAAKDTPDKRIEAKTPKSVRKTATKASKAEESSKTPASKTPRRAKKDDVSDDEEENEAKEDAEETKTPAKKVAKSAKGTPATPAVYDPYDFDTERESHPEPLKNIRMDFTSFGDVKYNKIGGGKYEQTERTAESRVSTLSELIPHSRERKSLAELTPGAKKRNTQSTSARKQKAASPDSPDVAKTPVSRTPRKRRTDSPKVASSAKRSKTEVVLPELDAEHLWAVDHPGDDDAPHEAGARVYALYDKIFYPAVVSVSGKDSLGRYKVVFVADMVVQNVPASGVIPLRALAAEHQCLFTIDPSVDPIDAVIISSPNAASAVEWKNAEFTIAEVTEGSDEVGEHQSAFWDKLSLSSEDWKEYIHKKSKETSEVMIDNISNVEDKRGRRSRGKGASLEKNADALKDSEAMDTSSGVEDDAVAKPLFAGMVFILTSAQRDGQTTFRKKLMSDFIEERGGIVVDDFASVDSYPDKKGFLISDTHYRTYKYLSALARGVPCVSHEWIWKCRDEGELASHEPFILPAGVSLVDQQVYPLPKNPELLLQGKIVLVNAAAKSTDSKTPSFVEVWEPIVVHLGGTALTTLPEKDVKVDVLLADPTVSEEFVEVAKENNALMASSEWLIQSLIMGRLPDISSHPRFSYDGTR